MKQGKLTLSLNSTFSLSLSTSHSTFTLLFISKARSLPSPNHPLPVCVLCLILVSKSTEMRTAMGHLAAAAHFCAMRSCKYLKVPKSEQRQTKQLCLRNIAFIKDGKILNHSSTNLNSANCITITFERQKNDKKADTVTQ